MQGNVDITSREHKAHPFPFYAQLRETAPVHPVTLPDKQTAWLITRYDDVAAVLADKRFAKDKNNALENPEPAIPAWLPRAFAVLTRNMLDLDEPDHTRLRALVNRAFTPQRVEGMRSRIQELAEELLAAVDMRRSFDLIKSYALPIPTTIIAEMLGIPASDRHKFSRWSKHIVAAGSSKLRTFRAIPNIWLFLRYIRRLVRARRSKPGDDLLSALVQADDQGQRLDEDELLAMVFLLLVAGHETTVNLIGNGVLALLEHPDQMEKLRSQPDLIEAAVEELLRYGSPLETATERYALEDVMLRGVTIPRGALVLAAIASANRDERCFEHPDDLDITRQPNRHLSFGIGSHYCLGAPLARLEGQIAIQTLLCNTSVLRLRDTPETLRWRCGLVLRGLESLPVVATPLPPSPAPEPAIMRSPAAEV